MSEDVFDVKKLAEKLSKLNNSQQSIQSLSLWCISHRKKAKHIVETWEKMFNPKDRCVSFLYLANDILQNSRRKGGEYVNEFWKVLPAALRQAYDNGDESGKKAAARLVEIWEERKVFGSRVQSLKDEIMAVQGKDPVSQLVSNGKSANPIKIMKKDAQSLRLKLAVGELPEKIVSAFHCLHDECGNEDMALARCDAAILSVEKIVKEVENTINQGMQLGAGIADEIQEQENVLEQCVKQLESAEATRATLAGLLKQALQEQEAKLENIRHQLLAANRRINELEMLKPQISSQMQHSVPAAETQNLIELTPPGFHGTVGPPILPTSTQPIESFSVPTSVHQIPPPTQQPAPNQLIESFQIPPTQQPAPSQPIESFPVHQIPPITQQQQPTTSFASMTTATDEESKKAAAAAVAAKLAASTSSAQMLTSILSSLVAEEAANMTGFPPSNNNLPVFSPDNKRQKLEHPQMPISQTLAPPLPPPPPPLMPPTNLPFAQSAGLMMNMMPPQGIGNNNGLPLPPHLPMSLARPLQPPQQPPQQGGGYYRPPGIGPYATGSQQPSTPPVNRQ